MRFTAIEQMNQTPIRAVIEPGRGPWVILVPAMEKPEPANIALIEFMRARSAVTGHGFASFLPAQPLRFDETANFVATKRLVEAVQSEQGARDFIVVAAPRERRTLSLLKSPAYRAEHIAIEPMEAPAQIFDTLPARAALAKRLAAVTTEIRNRSFAKHHHP